MTNQTDNSIWPIAKFHFQVKWDDHLLTFQEVSGLDTEFDSIEYRAGNDPRFSSAAMPGLVTSNDVTMKKGSFLSDNNFWGWYDHMRVHRAKTDVEINLVDESGQRMMTWTLTNAWPKQVMGTDLQDNGEQVAIESMVIAFETLQST